MTNSVPATNKLSSLMYGFIGDMASILAFALLARVAHSDRLDVSFVGWMQTAWPFLTGVLVAWIIMHFTQWEPTKVSPSGLMVWLSAVVIGLGLWGFTHGHVPHWSFMIVAGSTSAAFLLGWRAIVKLVIRNKSK